jgi:N-terminal region of Chorein or VPS13
VIHAPTGLLAATCRLSTDYDLSRGFIKQLSIVIPWTKLGSKPIELRFNTIEVIIKRAGKSYQLFAYRQTTAEI